jgi:hypothetical protein
MGMSLSARRTKLPRRRGSFENGNDVIEIV